MSETTKLSTTIRTPTEAYGFVESTIEVDATSLSSKEIAAAMVKVKEAHLLYVKLVRVEPDF